MSECRPGDCDAIKVSIVGSRYFFEQNRLDTLMEAQKGTLRHQPKVRSELALGVTNVLPEDLCTE